MKRIAWVLFAVLIASPLVVDLTPLAEARWHRSKSVTINRGSDVGACGNVSACATVTETVTKTRTRKARGNDVGPCHHADRGSCAGDKATCSGR